MVFGPVGPVDSPWNGGTPLGQGENLEGAGIAPDTYQKMFANRLLPERSRIEFHYGGDENTIIFLPFYENPKITESQVATYAEYNPVGRAGSLYSYMGSKSRIIKVDMTYTLPHLAMHEMGISRFIRTFLNTGIDAEKSLFTQFSESSPQPKPGDANKSLALAVSKAYWNLRNVGNESVVLPALDDLGSNTTNILSSMAPNEMTNILDTLLFFIAVLRTSVVNNAQDPMHGPPLLRLTFGTLYQSVPCICKSYNLSWEEDPGYHLETLTPHKIRIQLTLNEIRVGDFAEYKPAVFTQRDNLTGWESAVGSPYTTDPLPAAGFWADS
jgi:hypothetical protein